MATETAAVLEWNFRNVLIWVDRPMRLRNTYVVSELCQESVVCPERGPIF